ncbi:hypothetical protein BDZ89DRAFT_1160348 [Hymenopellis radicata]|nr:hypothetical protein BDZ89DRAFT_1160348 [Hymenopellis radicata]
MEPIPPFTAPPPLTLSSTAPKTHQDLDVIVTHFNNVQSANVDGFNSIITGLNNIIEILNPLAADLRALMPEMGLQSMRLYNSTTSTLAPLKYPPGIVPTAGGPLPLTRGELETLSGDAADAAIAALRAAYVPGLYPAAADLSAPGRVSHLAHYLGVY